MAREPSAPPPPAFPPPPARIDARAVWRLALRVIANFANDRVTFLAGGATFFILLGVFPALSAFLALYGLWADPAHAPELLQWLQGAVPPEILTYLGRQMRRLAMRGGGSLTIQFATSLVLWLWAADAAVKALIYGLNLAHHEVDTRNYFTYTWLTLRLTLAALVFALLASGAIAATPRIEASLGWQVGAPIRLLAIWRWPVLFVAYIAMLWTLYRWGPCRKPGRGPRRIWPGVFLAAALSMTVSALFSWYLADVAHLNTTYGPLGATVAFLLWTWLTVTALLAGGELNGELERCAGGS